MANPGVGTKFVSVNLNKSYGQPSHQNPSNSSYGSGRSRAVGYGGGGSGMVVLSRPRSSNKVGPKLSVPPPLNLPSLRKEHERFDSLGSGSGSVGGGGLGSGARPTSLGAGWLKPSVKNSHPFSGDSLDHGLQSVEGVTKGGSSAYIPPSARFSTSETSVSALLRAENDNVLRGEDFPSLRATLVAPNRPSQMQKDALHKKQRQGIGEESSQIQRESSHLSSQSDRYAQVQCPQHSASNGFGGNMGDNHGVGNSWPFETVRKQEDIFPGPFPLVRLSPRPDWIDDERDTGHGFTDRGRDNGFSRTESYWDKDFDLPRASILPYKQAQNLFDRQGQHKNDIGNTLSSEVPKADPSNRHVRTPSREGCEGKSWRSSVLREGLKAQDVASDINGMGARTASMNKEISKENKHTQPQFGGNARDGYNSGITAGRDLGFGRTEAGYGQGGRQQWSFSRGTVNGQGDDWNLQDRMGNDPSKFEVEAIPNGLVSKSSFSTTSKGLSKIDPMVNFGREKHTLIGGVKPYVEDPFLDDWGHTGFDGRDPFSPMVITRKKDVNKQVDFHDPVRESFEAELERVQKMQEQERQRTIEEQERALEMAWREEEERQRVAKEQEELQRRLEEEAREAAWRAEQERLEAIRRAEEHKIAKEKENQRILMEEERRKQAAMQKLLELEERIARRQAEAMKDDSSAVADEKMPGVVKDSDVTRAEDLGSWEDSERMVERITNSASSDSSSLNRSFVSRPQSIRDSSFAFTERGKPLNSWRRDAFDNSHNPSLFPLDQENGPQSPLRDVSVGGRSFPRKDFPSGAGHILSRGFYSVGMSEPCIDDSSHPNGHRWDVSGDGDPYGRNIKLDSEFHQEADKFCDMGWGHDHISGNLQSPSTEQLYQNPEQGELYSYGRSRYSARQPRVLPPPSFVTKHNTPFRSESEHAGLSTYEDGNVQDKPAVRSEPAASVYYNGHPERQEHSDVIDVQGGCSETEEHKLNDSNTPRCDSQLSLSVSSPPTSPTHLSHDGLYESGDSPVVSSPAERTEVSPSGNESFMLTTKAEKENLLTGTATSSILLGDDEEWTVDDNEELQEQEEYDEDEDGYREEDEVHEGNENADLTQGFAGMHLARKDSDRIMDNLVLGFDQGVEVGMPSEEYERSPRNVESSYAVPQAFVVTMGEQESYDGRRDDGNSPEFADGSPHMSANSSRTVQETKNEVEDMVIQPINVPHGSAPSDILNCQGPMSVLSVQQSLPSSVDMRSHSFGQVVTSSAAAVEGQPELPVKLQFGLFSGPSLIPSPVPAIQIGSIQMPLQLHPSQPPLFQFGQIRYPSTISQGILPLAPQSVSFVQANVPTHYPLNQKLGGHLFTQPFQSNHVHPSKLSSSHDIMSKEANLVLGRRCAEGDVLLHQNRADISATCENQARPVSGHHDENVGYQYNAMSNAASMSTSGESEGQPQTGASTQSISGVKDVNGRTAQAPLPGSRWRKFAFTARSHGRKYFLSSEASRSDSNAFQMRPPRGAQRMEFRVRHSADRNQSSPVVSSNHTLVDAALNYNEKDTGLLPGGGLTKKKVSDKTKEADESVSFDLVKPQEANSEIMTSKGAEKDIFRSGRDTSLRGDPSLKWNSTSEGDTDAPLQSGVVRIFEQPGIEAPSDEDDFIEVRSKRQMLNNRREQKQKENKAKSDNIRKASRRPQSVPQGTVVVSTVKATALSSEEAPDGIHADYIQKQALVNNEVCAAFNIAMSQPLAPIGIPSVNPDAHDDANSQIIKSQQTVSFPIISSGGQAIAPSLIFETNSDVPDNAETSLGSWGNPWINQQVMPLTQNQLNEAMKPEQFNTPSTSAGGISKLPKDMIFSSATSPVNSLLAGEKIQFGAVTSPTILAPSTRVVSHCIGPPVPSQSDFQASQNMSVLESKCALLFEKEAHSSKNCVQLEDCEAETEAESTASSVATIRNDEVAVNGLDTCSISILDSRSFGHADVKSMKANVAAGDQQAMSQSKAEETLSISLPADLSVETFPISLWPPLPSPHSSSSQILSPLPGNASSRFPFYDINPILGGPIFAFGPHDESASTQLQPWTSSASGSGLLGAWQHCGSGVDSFYGAAGFARPFINHSVQGPPHMVVYNHFAPVGQFGQVGLSYMGYIPSGKQPDWKHNPLPAAMVVGEGDMMNLNIVSAQRNPPVPHLAPGSPHLSMVSPLAMFDVSPFQSTPDLSIQGHWTPIPASPLCSIPQSTPMQQPAAGVVPFNHGYSDVAASQFPDELRLVNPLSSTAPAASSDDVMTKSSSRSTSSDAERMDTAAQDANGCSKSIPRTRSSIFKTQSSQQKHSSPQPYDGPSIYHYHRGGCLYQKNGSGAESSNRKTGFHGRNHSSASDRGLPLPKVKQIYVAKQSLSGT